MRLFKHVRALVSQMARLGTYLPNGFVLLSERARDPELEKRLEGAVFFPDIAMSAEVQYCTWRWHLHSASSVAHV
jgi:hypothetical protein